MRWEDERYVRLYTRNTPEWLALSWQARGVFALLMREVDRAGLIKVGKLGLKGVAVAIGARWPDIETAVAELLDDGCVRFDEGRQVVWIPNFIEAQEAVQSDAARKRTSRERARASMEDRPSVSSNPGQTGQEVTIRDAPAENVTPGHGESQPVTSGPEQSQEVTLCCAVPNLAEPNRDRALAREETPTGSTVPKTEPVALSEAQERKPDGALPDGLVHFERKAWVEAYQDAVNQTARIPKDDPWTLPEKKFNALRKIVETRCRGEARKNIPEWIRAEVADFVRAVIALNQDVEKFWNDYDPDGLQRWHNRQRPGLTRVAPPKPPRLSPLPEPTMSREAYAAAAQQGIDMLKRGETGPRPK